jgi:hypothetical protein
VSRRATVLIGALAAITLAGCGGDKRTIPHDEGSTLIRLLREARSQAGHRSECDALQRTVARVQAEVAALPASVDTDTRRSLTDGANNLADSAQQECRNAHTTPTTPTTPTTTTQTQPTQTQAPTQTQPPTQSTPTHTTPSKPQKPPKKPPDGGEGNGGASGPGKGNANGNGDGNGTGGAAPGQEKKGKKDNPSKGHGK